MAQREGELKFLVDACLEGEWRLPFKQLPHTALYINFFRHERAVSLSLCQYLVNVKYTITREQVLATWVKIANQMYQGPSINHGSREKLKEIVDVFLADSPDMPYQFYMIGEYYRLQEGEDAEVLLDVHNFYMKMTEAIEHERLQVGLYNLGEKYDNVALDVSPLTHNDRTITRRCSRQDRELGARLRSARTGRWRDSKLRTRGRQIYC